LRLLLSLGRGLLLRLLLLLALALALAAAITAAETAAVLRRLALPTAIAASAAILGHGRSGQQGDGQSRQNDTFHHSSS
jgi:hypothetical protein